MNDDDLKRALQQCESEPIHLIGSIQPHGMLLVVGPEPERLILQASQNATQLLGCPVAELLNRPLRALPELVQLEALCEQPNEPASKQFTAQITGVVVNGEQRELLVTPHHVPPLTLLELEPLVRLYQPEDMLRLQFQAQEGIARMQRQEDIDRTLDVLAELVQQLTGYHHVMVYRFDHNWEGEVVAEKCHSDNLPSYLGHRFPASDIPAQARELYRRHPIRLMVDTQAVPSPLLPAINPLTLAPLDLSATVLRSLSPIHVEYLRNMGVQASMSASLVVEGKLWGMIACHHHGPKQLGHPIREMVKFIGQTAATKIESLCASLRSALNLRLNEALSRMLDMLHHGRDMTQQLWAFEKYFSTLIPATGILIRVGGRAYRRGVLPPDDLLTPLVDWLAAQAPVCVFNPLAEVFPGAAAHADTIAGVLAVNLDGTAQGRAGVGGARNGIYWFKPEKIREVKWAGKPQKVVATDASGHPRLSPRKSFATWVETWRGRCESWQQAEIDLAGSIGHLVHQAFTLLVAHSIRYPAASAQDASRDPDLDLEALVDPRPLLKNLPAGVVVHADDTRILYANPQALQLLRLSEEQALGRQALRAEWNLIDESGRCLTVAEYPVNRVLATGDTLTGLVVGIVDQLQPEPTWVLIHAYPQVDASGERQVIVTFVNISDRQRIPFRQIVDLANDAVVVTEASPLDPPGPRIVYVNQSFTQLTGYSPEEVIGRTPRMFQGEKTDRATQERIRAALAGNQSLRESLVNYRRNGSTYWIDLNINPLFDHNGQVKYFVAIERDVTSLIEESIGLRNAAATDALTGLLNRRGFSEQFQRLCRIAFIQSRNGSARPSKAMSSRLLARPSPSAWAWRHGNLRIP